MFGYSKDSFGCSIGYVKNGIAFVEVTDKDGDKSFMEIDKGDLIAAKIIVSVGTIFSFTLKNFLGWEKITFKPIKRGRKITREEVDRILKKYEDRYGDL